MGKLEDILTMQPRKNSPMPCLHLNSTSVTACYTGFQIKKSPRFSEFKTAQQDWLHEPIRQEHTTVLRKLHWLPIKKRIIYKILELLLTYKSLKGLPQDYLRDLLDLYVPTRILRSRSKHLLVSLESEQTTMVDVLFLRVHLSTETNYPPISNRQLP